MQPISFNGADTIHWQTLSNFRSDSRNVTHQIHSFQNYPHRDAARTLREIKTISSLSFNKLCHFIFQAEQSTKSNIM